MQVQLPPTKPFRQQCSHQNGWSDHYGALHVAAAYSGLVMPPRYTIKGVWQHGVFGPWQHFSPDILVYNAPGASARPVFVARQDEKEVLQRRGYQDVRVIGLPIVYVPDPEVARIPGSLLVVPTHSLNGDQHPDRTLFQQYADSIKAVAGRFSRVVVCVHPNCRRNGLWVKEFTAAGIEITYGAETGDANALLRMRMLFAQFESVTTNEWGSHVAYALAFGARVSIAGQPIACNPQLQARDEMWKNDPAAMARAFSADVAQARREFLQRLYVAPHEGVADEAFGRWFIGADNQLPSEKMREALAALLDPAPISAMPPSPSVRLQAAELAAAGQPQEAARLLLRLVRAAVETKDPRFIHETLVEVVADLAPLDAARAAVLREQADKLAGRLAAATA